MQVELTDIQYGCTHDGPGIRTVLFFKGCPLHCRWCHNPEAMSPERELLYRPYKCIGCGRCAAVCPQGAHSVADGVHAYDPDKCTACMACAAPFVCPPQAIEPASRSYDTAEAVALAVQDAAFYRERGGITLSGGEPTFQPEAFRDIVTRAKAAGLSVCIETCGAFDADMAAFIAANVDTVLFDIKDTDPDRHLQNTGWPLEAVLETLRALDDGGVRLRLRCVLIPEVNMTEEHAKAVAALRASLAHCDGVDLLPYHTWGLSKAECLARHETEPFTPPTPEQVAQFAAWMQI